MDSQNGSAQTLQTHACHACGETHDDVTLKPYSKPHPPWTHFYICPLLGEPVSLCVQTLNDAPVALNRKLINDVAQMTLAGSYFVCTAVMADGKLTMHHHRDRFPRDGDALERFEAWVAKKVAETRGEGDALPPPDAPLKRATLTKTFKIDPGNPLGGIIDKIRCTPGALSSKAIEEEYKRDAIEDALKHGNAQVVSQAAHGDRDEFSDPDRETEQHDDECDE